MESALNWLKKMPASYQTSSSALLLETQIYVKANNLDNALQIAQKGCDLYPEETKFWEAKARIFAMQGKMSAAIKLMQEAVKKWPNDMNMHFLLANITDESGDKKTALKLMEAIIEKEPNNFQALNYVGYSLAEANKNIDRAIQLLERAIKLAPDRAYIVDSLAWAYFRAGRQNDALREIRRAIKLESNLDPAIWEHYGDIAKHSGLKQEARKAYTKALELHPTNAAQLRKKLANLN